MKIFSSKSTYSIQSFLDPSRIQTNVTYRPKPKAEETPTRANLTKIKIPTAKIDDTLEKMWKDLEDKKVAKPEVKQTTIDTKGKKTILDHYNNRVNSSRQYNSCKIGDKRRQSNNKANAKKTKNQTGSNTWRR